MRRLLPFVGARAFEEPLGIGYDRQELETSVLGFPAEHLERITEQENGFCAFLESAG